MFERKRIHSRILDQIHLVHGKDTFEIPLTQIHFTEIIMPLIVKSHDDDNLNGELSRSNYSLGSCSSLPAFYQYLSDFLLFSLYQYRFHDNQKVCH